jgi:hypothetical protein
MKHRHQSGLSSLSLLIILSASAFFLLVVFRVGPLYLDNYFVSSALKNMGDETLVELRDDEIRRKLQAYFTINNIRDISMRTVEIERDREGVLIKIDYEKRVNFLGNADVIVTFTNHLHSSDYR